MSLNTPDFSELKAYKTNKSGYPNLGVWAEKFIDQARGRGAKEGAQRLALVGKQFKKLSLEEAYNIIDPDAILAELEARRERTWLGFLHVMRNGFGLLPLILTWYALYQASTDYQRDLAKYPNDVYQPFLLLWQQGFHGFGTSWLTFSKAAWIDVWLLVSYVCLILLIPIIESIARSWHNRFATDLQTITDDLLDAVGVAGISPITSDADIDKIVKAITRVIDRALLASDQVSQEAKRVVTAFHSDLATFNADLKQLTTDLQTHNQQIQALTAASTQLAGSSNTLAANANQLAASAGQSAQANQDIGNQLGTLNNTQQQMITTIGNTQQQVVSQIGAVAGSMNNSAGAVGQATKDMNTAAGSVEKVGRQLTTINPADINAMAAQARNVATTLYQVDAALQGTVQALQKLMQVAQPTPRKKTRVASLS